MRQSKHIPEHHVLLHSSIVPFHSVRYTALLVAGLQSVPACGIEFMVLVFRDPDMLLREQSPVILQTIRAREQFLGRGRNNLVTDRLTTDGILLLPILDFESPAGEGVDVQTCRGGDRSLADFIPVPIGVRGGIDLHRQRFFVDDSVFMSIYRGINPDAKAMLMVLSQSTGTNDIAPISRLASIDIDDGNDTSSASFDHNPACLVEFVGEDVLVIRERDDELHHQFATSGHYGAFGAPIGMFPVDPVVLLVNADDVGSFLAFAVGAYDYAVEVFDDA